MAEKQGHVDDLFDKLIVTVRAHTSNDEEVINLLKRRYKKANPSFTGSDEFVSLMKKLGEQITHDSKNKYIHIKDFIEELKAYGVTNKKRKKDALTTDSDTDSCAAIPSKRPRCSSPTDNKAQVTVTSLNSAKTQVNDTCAENSTSGKNHLHSVQEVPVSGVKIPASSKSADSKCSKSDKTSLPSCNNSPKAEKGKQNAVSGSAEPGDRTNINVAKVQNGAKEDCKVESSLTKSDESTSEQNTGNEERCGVRKKGSHRQIQRLEKLLGEISEEIKRLEVKEYTLDQLDEEDSDSILEDKLRKRFIKVWNKICELKGRDTTTGRVVERKFRFEGTRFPEVNQKIEKFVNKLKIFPDYNDIHDIVYRVNIKKHLRLGKAAVDSLARDAFTAVGNQLQQRRQNDFVDNFGCHLTDNYRSYDDPALYDRSLKKKLEENSNVGKSRLEHVISKFAYRQDTGGDATSDEESKEEEEGSAKSDNEDDQIISNEIQKENETQIGSSDDDDEGSNSEAKRHDDDSSSDPQEVFLVPSSDDSDDDTLANDVKLAASSQSASSELVKIESTSVSCREPVKDCGSVDPESDSGSLNLVKGSSSESLGRAGNSHAHHNLWSSSLDTSQLCSNSKRSKLSFKEETNKPYVYIDRMDEDNDLIEIDSDESPDVESRTYETSKVSDSSPSSDHMGARKRAVPIQKSATYKLNISDSFKEKTKKIAERQLKEQIKEIAPSTAKTHHKNVGQHGQNKSDSDAESDSSSEKVVPCKVGTWKVSHKTVISGTGEELTSISTNGSQKTGSSSVTSDEVLIDNSDDLLDSFFVPVKKEHGNSGSAMSNSGHTFLKKSPTSVTGNHSKQSVINENHSANSDTDGDSLDDSDVIILDD